MPSPPLVCDTTVPLCLGRIGQINLLPVLFAPVFVPAQVSMERDLGRLLRPDTIDPRSLDRVEPAAVPQALIDSLSPNRLGTGEQAEALGLKVVGTLGILLLTKRAGPIPTVRPLVDDAIAQGFRLSPELYQDVLGLAAEAPRVSPNTS